MTFDQETLALLGEALKRLDTGFDRLPGFVSDVDPASLREVLLEVAERLRDNYPYQHPLYVGQMLKPPDAVARLAYALTLWLNPNNHALDGGRASSRMEKEAVANIAEMFGWKEHLGHLCGGGTVANLEALWIGRELHPGRVVVASSAAHYTHARLCKVLGIPFRTVAIDARGRMDVAALETELAQSDVGTVVVTLGTTGTGSVDPLDRVLALRDSHEFRIHVDTAYAGFYALASNLDPDTRRAFDALQYADSIVVDPHKHGLQPYGCGCILFRDPSVGTVYQHESPYTYFTSDELHLGEISLECSRPGAAAVALWATQRLYPYEQGGRFARKLEKCRETALRLYDWLLDHRLYVPLLRPELDIVTWGVRANRASESSRLARVVFAEAARRDLHLALADLPRVIAGPAFPDMQWDSDTLTCLRSCVMKPEHGDWLGEITERLGAAGDSL